jgi:7,8-dihydroneopterin aldolase/epimerase/oxygenase
MLTIHLNNVKFFAYHGLYEHEKVNGNEFEVNLVVHYFPQQICIDRIEDTVDYAQLFQLVSNRMAIATPLLETLVMEIANSVIEQFTMVAHVFVSIAKLKPPIPNYQGSVTVSYELSRK